ncbi:oxidoreductase [Plectosphaerella plurivora]|uniref:Oxidoreductase n=1 Tax=Plectosphaerella plurivora TaxID=936078 RepID=A0A9P8VEU7_9PEZI|nr:oxidoreductase [Plectosphaerella plurivora]
MTDYIVAGIDMKELYPKPFPDNIPTIELQTVSLAKLLSKDDEEADRIFKILKDPGFFQLDLTDHPQGVELLRDVVECHGLAKKLFTTLPLEQKLQYKTRKTIGIFDRGYFNKDPYPNGAPRWHELFNFPLAEMFGIDTGEEFNLPTWLQEHEVLLKRTMTNGTGIAMVILQGIEKGLHLPEGTITAAHQLKDPSGDFLRLLRYPSYDPAKIDTHLTFPPHKDAISLDILFNFLGGLQIAGPDATWLGHEAVTEDSWRWVKPVPGHAIINIGDALELLTNKALTSGLHRVVRTPGEQSAADRYSIVLGLRPRNDIPMVPFQSPLIPKMTEEQEDAPVLTSSEWGDMKIKKLVQYATTKVSV